MVEEKTYEYKGQIITESQLSNLIRDRKYWLNEFRLEVRNNIKTKKKLTTYERLIGFLIFSIIVLGVALVLK